MDWIADHEDQAVARLPELYRQPRIEAFVRVLTRRHQGLEDALRGLFEGWMMGNLEGVQLDGLGELLRAPRGALGDADYRLRLSARIRLLRGSGTPDELLGLIIFLQPSLRVRLAEEFPAALELQVSGGTLPLPDVHLELVRTAKAGGVRVCLRYQYTDDENTFRCAARYSFLTLATGAGDDTLAVQDVRPFQTGAVCIVVIDEGTPRQQFREVSEVVATGAGPAGFLTVSGTLAFDVEAGAVVRPVDQSLDPGAGFDTTGTAVELVTMTTVALPLDSYEVPTTGDVSFPDDSWVVLEPGTARQELKRVLGSSGGTLSLATGTRFFHAAGSTVRDAASALLPPGRLSSVR